jgi:hypothetical protein
MYNNRKKQVNQITNCSTHVLPFILLLKKRTAFLEGSHRQRFVAIWSKAGIDE